jgi:ABC-type nitrate/sulfonate/bicarbonate transport system substrate-binding protein
LHNWKFGLASCVSVVIAMSALSAGCSSQARIAVDSALTRPGETDITVAALPTDDLAGLYIAQDDGLFTQQGLHVTIDTISSSQRAEDRG